MSQGSGDHESTKPGAAEFGVGVTGAGVAQPARGEVSRAPASDVAELERERQLLELARLRSPLWTLLAIIGGIGPLVALLVLFSQQRESNRQQISQDSLRVQQELFEVIKDLTTATTLAAKIGAVARLKPIWQRNPRYRALFATSALVIAEEDDFQVRNEIRGLILSEPDFSLLEPIADANRGLQQRILREGVSSHLVWPTSDTTGQSKVVRRRWREFEATFPKAVKLDGALRWNIDLLIEMLRALPAEGASASSGSPGQAAGRAIPLDLSGVQLSRLVYKNEEFDSEVLPRDVTQGPIEFTAGNVKLARAYLAMKILVGLRDTLTLDSALVFGTHVKNCQLPLLRARALSVELGATDRSSRQAIKGAMQFTGCKTIHFRTLSFQQSADEGSHVLMLNESKWSTDDSDLTPGTAQAMTCRAFASAPPADKGFRCP